MAIRGESAMLSEIHSILDFKNKFLQKFNAAIPNFDEFVIF